MPPPGTSANAIGIVDSPARRVQLGTSRRVLFVADGPASAIHILKYGSWANLGAITNGINGPSAESVDKKGNLYVANGGTVTEFDLNGNLLFTYSANMYSAEDVKTDQYGNVFEADTNGVTGVGAINEYEPGVNSVAFSCAMASNTFPTGVAIDRGGDVFVAAYNHTTLASAIIEYKHGLLDSHCVSTTLPITEGFAEGIALDTQRNLLITDIVNHAVYIAAPPYASITGTLGSGWTRPQSVSIDRAGTQAYVSDPTAQTVTVLSYPSGSVVATLGSADGIGTPVAAVDSKNYVP